VATDLSESAAAVHRVAMQLARRLDARATLIHVNEVAGLRTPAVSPGTAARWRWVLKDLARQETERLDQARAAFENAAVPTDTMTISNNPAVEISETAHAHDFDLVVLGRQGVRQIEREGVGRTTRQVLRRCRVPAVVVPNAYQPSGSGPQRLLATSDFTPACVAGLHEAAELAVQLETTVDVVHVVRLPMPFNLGAMDWHELFPEESLAETRDMLALHVKQTLDRTLAGRCNPISARGTSVAEVLRDLAGSYDTGLITIPARGERPTGLLGSTTENVLRLSPVPVLVFPVAFLKNRSHLTPTAT
jgi:nucleotide-binding universal stress UspA family protein